MKKTESLFICAGLMLVLGGVGVYFLASPKQTNSTASSAIPMTKFGGFLAAQHAVYVNDFDRAVEFTNVLDATDPIFVQNTKMLAEFLGGKMPENIDILKDEASPAARLIYDTQLALNKDWSKLYTRHKKDATALTAPFRIWASVGAGKTQEAIKFVNKLKTNDSWQAFVRGQIKAATGDISGAAQEFAGVQLEFLNINDYFYLMSFYTHHDMADRADSLHAEFTARPGGMYMMDYNGVRPWEIYDGVDKQLAFSLIQNVSHTQLLMYSDLSLMMLRMAEIIGAAPENRDVLDYYIGQYFYNNTGDCEKYFARIPGNSPLRAFADLRMVERGGDIKTLDRTVMANPLFVPGVLRLVAHYVQHDDRTRALKVLDSALKHPDLSEIGHAFFMKTRAQTNLTFGRVDAAQADIDDAVAVLPMDADILAVQAKIWATTGENLDEAYNYAMSLIRKNAADVSAWDTLGRVVAAREGVDAALDLLARVADVSTTCSSLFDFLGDLHVMAGNTAQARDAYIRAIELSDDGLVVRPTVDKKLRKLK